MSIGQKCFRVWVLAGIVAAGSTVQATEELLQRYEDEIQPILANYCFDCHADGMDRGGMAFDSFESAGDLFTQYDLWNMVVHRLRAETMPPGKRARPSAQDIDRIADWVKHEVFEIDPENPDPGHVTLRRMNRTEYRNTIRDLMGTDFNTFEEFPADDTGYGFDNVGDALSISPLLMEKYIYAAESIVFRSVPTVAKVPRAEEIGGTSFRAEKGGANGGRLPFDRQETIARTFEAKVAGTYQIEVEYRVNGGFDFQPGRCDLTFKIGDETEFEETLGWETQRTRRFATEKRLEEGKHTLQFVVTPESEPEEKTSLSFRIDRVRMVGPVEQEHWIAPSNYTRFFHREEAPPPGPERDSYTREVLERFASRAFRHPVDAQTVERLGALARMVDEEPGKGFEDGIRQAMVAVLASPRFVFFTEAPLPSDDATPFPQIDEYTLAARLSYFLWSTMPDAKLTELAAKGELSENLDSEIARMLSDGKSKSLIENFTGQWLQTRDVETVPIDVRAVLGRRDRDRDLPSSLRRAMRAETTAYFEHIVEEDRDVLELVDSNYTFLNEELAKHYGIPGVEGDRMQRVELPEDSPRGGVITQGSLLTVTSNPTRTSPVKRGVFILESILGSSTPSPPPDVPELEEAASKDLGRKPTPRELLELHRNSSLCRSCHDRFDPMGIALENFNAIGMWREEDADQKIDASGTLISGEAFNNIIDLKRILVNERKMDFYRCITEKLLTYALGRGIEYYDVHTVDTIVDKLAENGGRFSVLLEGVVHAAPFQRMRRPPTTGSSINLAQSQSP